MIKYNIWKPLNPIQSISSHRGPFIVVVGSRTPMNCNEWGVVVVLWMKPTTHSSQLDTTLQSEVRSWEFTSLKAETKSPAIVIQQQCQHHLPHNIIEREIITIIETTTIMKNNDSCVCCEKEENLLPGAWRSASIMILDRQWKRLKVDPFNFQTPSWLGLFVDQTRYDLWF